MLSKLLLVIYLVDANLIKNIDLPSCRNCKYYKPRYNSDYSSTLSKCSIFGRKDIHTDEISYDYADLCRNDKDKCGLHGKYFEEESNVEFKILSHNFTNYFTNSLPFIVCFFLSLLNVIIKNK
jgi:hypothetical protein